MWAQLFEVLLPFEVLSLEGLPCGVAPCVEEVHPMMAAQLLGVQPELLQVVAAAP